MNRYQSFFVRFAAGLLALFLLLCTLPSCGESNEQTPENSETVQFTDALGRLVSVPKNPVRVAALIGSFADIWCLSGGTLCAAASDAWEDFGLALDGAVNIGGAHSPNTELLLSSNPELVIASASTASNVALKDTLDAMGIPVAYFNVDHFNDYLQMLDICTDLTGRKDLYEQNGLALQTQIESLKSAYTAQPIPQEQRKILLLRASSGSIKAKSSSGTILGEMLKDMGCINIADRDSSLLENLSVESIIREEPYHIFAVTMGNDTTAATEALDRMIRENPAWSSLSAVRENRIHIMDKRLFNLKPNARWAEAYGVLYETLTKQT
ncbi:MAG: ABC transporter substrate-binding protein [Clostridia bacterium]|nr:ABC transporter substrate-binding protein [Clostridia bacterium]